MLPLKKERPKVQMVNFPWYFQRRLLCLIRLWGFKERIQVPIEGYVILSFQPISSDYMISPMHVTFIGMSQYLHSPRILEM